MRQANNIEVEIRFRISDIKKFHRKLKENGFKCTEYWRGSDTLFDRKNELRSGGRPQRRVNFLRGELLRLRLRKHWGKKAKLTYKGPYRDRIFKVREELETWVDEPEMARKILEALGYSPVIQYEKRTELWVDKNEVEVVVEKLPEIGYFTEIEGSGKNIRKVAEILGYNIKKGIKKSYREYYAEINKKKKGWFFGR
jgi:predicted adenylyl cyclase CyaB